MNQPVRFDGLGGLTPDSIFTSGGDDDLRNIDRSIFTSTGAGNDSVSLVSQGTVVTGMGNDFVLGSQDGDSIVTGEGNDSVNAQAGSDFVDAGAGNDFIDGGDGNNTVAAGAGNNTVATGTGADSVTAEDGNDTITTGDGADTVRAGDGTNTVRSGAGADLVVTGIGNDSINTTGGASEVDNDTVDSGDGNDSIFVGLGDDTVNAGLGNDFIFLSENSGVLQTPVGTVFANEPGGLSLGDRINGGGGFDLLALQSVVDITLSGVQIQDIEVVNVYANASDVDVTVSTDLFPGNGVPVAGQSVLEVVYAGDLSTEVDGSVDASSLVQGEAINLTIACIDDFTALGGAGNDRFATVTNNVLPVRDITIQGNGGSDSIDLTARATATAATIVYATGNDGGTGGSGTGGDFITGYSAANDQIQITNGLLTDIGGLLSANVTNSQLVLGSLGDFTGIFQTTDTGRNILSLTGPARSLTDAQLFDADAIANNINGVGVVGNGRDIGDSIGIFTTVTNVTNQALILQQGQTQTALYLYTESSFDFETARAYTVEENELRQLGVFDNALFTGTELV